MFVSSQSNPWRHLSEVSDMVEVELRRAERACLQGAKVKDTNELRCLEEAWGMFKDVSVPGELFWVMFYGEFIAQ